MPACCVAYGCYNKGKIKGITYHRFPKKKDLRKKWLEALNREDWEPSKYSHLCSLHFREEDIDRTSLVTVRIRENRVPSIFSFESCSKSRKKIRKNKPPSDPGKAVIDQPSTSQEGTSETNPKDGKSKAKNKKIRKKKVFLDDQETVKSKEKGTERRSSSQDIRRVDIESLNVNIKDEAMYCTDDSAPDNLDFTERHNELQGNVEEERTTENVEHTSENYLTSVGIHEDEFIIPERVESSIMKRLHSGNEIKHFEEVCQKEDDTDVFFKSMAMTAKTFHPRILANLKKKICVLVMDHQIENEKLTHSIIRNLSSSSFSHSSLARNPEQPTFTPTERISPKRAVTVKVENDLHIVDVNDFI